MSNLLDRVKLFVQRNREFRSALYDIMGFYPHDIELYRIAFAHKSQEYKSKRTGDRPLNNERLEFLGDAVLETVVSDIVYHHFKNKREGFLTNTRSKIVSRESLGKLAKDLGIDRLIQSHTSGKAHNSFLAGNAFEALMGAIYLDRGFDYAFRFIEHRIMGSVLDLEGVAHKEVNFKSKLLEWSQKNRIRIDFRDQQTAASSSSTPVFSTTIVLESLFAGDGKGFSKKEAHQNAAKEALMRMRREPRFIDDIFRSKEKRTAMEADPCFVLPVIDEIEADLAREAEEKRLKAERKQERNNDKKKAEHQPKQKKAKAEQPKQEQPKPQQAKAAPQQAKAAPQQAKEEPKKEHPEVTLIPIAMEEISVAEAPATEEVPTMETPIAEAIALVESAAVEPAPAKSEAPAKPEESTESEASTPAEAAPTESAPVKKSRRRGKRQNAAGYTNTETIPAETSHRAEKAAKKVDEAKKEKARRKGHKTAKAASKGVEAEVPQPAEPSQPSTDAPSSSSAPAAAPAKKKPRRRKKSHAELPSETPNPEREQAIAAAENAAYNQNNTED